MDLEASSEVMASRLGLPYLVKRTAEAAEIAEAVALLATNRYLTGSTLAADGGRTLH